MNIHDAQGLCMTCNYVDGCVYLANSVSAVWRCEEFDDRPVAANPQQGSATEEPVTGEEAPVMREQFARTA